MKKRRIIIFFALIFIAVLSILFGYNSIYKSTKNSADAQNMQTIKALVLYSGEDEGYKDTLSQLTQTLNATSTVSASVFDDEISITDYDVIYPDKSIIKTLSKNQKEKLVAFVENGGFLFLTNEFLNVFEPQFFGATEILPVGEFPKEIKYLDVGDDYSDLQGIIKDFEYLYRNYYEFIHLSKKDYGYCVINDSAVSLAQFDGKSIYGINNYKNGYVFYTNPMLPNVFSINGFSMERRNEDQTYFANSTASANQIILGEFLSFASKKIYGYAVERVLASFASPAASWQLHYEEITGIENDSAILFGELCKIYNQIPSYTLIRNSYKWHERAESVTYYINDDNKFNMDYNQSAYSSGTHVIMENSEYLRYNSISDPQTYFKDLKQYTQTAYIEITDVNKDKVADIISGSYDGYFYYNEGQAFKNGEWHVLKTQKLKNSSGYEIKLNAFSSPTLCDINNDNIPDLISGCSDGYLYWFLGNGDNTYDYQGILLEDYGLVHSMPDCGDFNGDGVVDLAVSGANGKVLFFIGEMDENGKITFNKTSKYDKDFPVTNEFLCARIYDYNKDGKNDIVMGCFDGYVRIYLNNNDGFEFSGYIESNELNYKGNSNLKVGTNSVPVFYDLNNDKKDDLIIGALEYGMAIPIDSKYFPLREELQRQVDYILDNDFYLGMHFYSNLFASTKREEEEIRLHNKALESYGINTKGIGSNQHTWRTSTLSDAQTLHNLKDNGILWSSGAVISGGFVYPHAGSENTLSNAFFLDYDNKKMLILGTATLLGSDYGDMALKYDLPISQYYHCDFAYQDRRESIRNIELLNDAVIKNNYCFVKEDQLVKAIAASLNADISVINQNGEIKMSQTPNSTDFDLYDKNYQNSVGVKIEFSQESKVDDYIVDANVWRVEKNSIYLGLDKEVTIRKREETDSKISSKNILRINTPAKVTNENDEFTVSFYENGLMQVFISGNVKTDNEGWNLEYINGVTKASKFGKAEKVKFYY